MKKLLILLILIIALAVFAACGTPDTPAEPDTPGDVTRPDTPDTPDGPEQPDTPDEPEKTGMAPELSQDGKSVLFGYYPQTHVADAALIAALDAKAAQQWVEHEGKYYVQSTAKPYPSAQYKFADGTAIESGKAYWFECEKISWRVLSSTDGEYFLLSEHLLDAGAYHTDYSANKFEESSLKAWLSGEFADAAFALCGDYLAKPVALLSYEDCFNSAYGFGGAQGEKNSALTCKPTDYALANGAWLSADGTTSYWTSTPSANYSYCAWNVNSGGHLSEYAVDDVSHGIRPVITVVK